MDQQQQQQTQNPPPPSPPPTTATSQPTETPSLQPSQHPLQPPTQQQQQQEQTPTPPPTSQTSGIPTTNTSNPNPNLTAKPTSHPPPQPRSTSFSRPWQHSQQQQQLPHFSHFSSLHSSSSSSSASPSSSSPISAPPRGGIAIGVPATRPSTASPQSVPPFSSSFGQQFGGLGRGGVNVPDSVRPPGMQGIGVMGSLGTSSRPGGMSVQHHQLRPAEQSSLRPPPSPNSQSSATPNFQGQGLMRVSPVGSPGPPSPNTSQSAQSFNQPWLSSGSQGKPPLPPPSTYRPQMNTSSMQQRSHIPRQHSPFSTTLQQQHAPSVLSQQSKSSHQVKEHYGQQFSSPRVPQSAPHQQQTGTQISAIQKSSTLASVQPGYQSKITSAESDEFGNRILSKRSIHELVNQIDPSERLDSEVEDILVDIAEDFVESITAFGCSLAKHRKSDTLEAKDILLHLERDWNMTLPGFSSDEIKTYRKPHTNDIHKERLAVIKKSIMATEVASTRSAGQAAANAKGNMGKMPASIGSTRGNF